MIQAARQSCPFIGTTSRPAPSGHTAPSPPQPRAVPRLALSERWARSSKFVEQCLRFFEVLRVKALGKPAVDGSEQVARLASPALLAPQPGEARGGAQFVASRALLAGDREGGAERIIDQGMATD